MSPRESAVSRVLPPVARHIDAELARLEDRIDWLWSLSPIHNDAMWQEFRDSGFRTLPPMRYGEKRTRSLPGLREELLALPIADIEEPLFESLLGEKQRELDRQMELVRLRDKPGFHQASIDLFGDVPARLRRAAREVMAAAAPGGALPRDAGLDEVVAAAEEELDWYRERWRASHRTWSSPTTSTRC
ncbi:tyrosine/phenylalanine carboxypeptidase domain-containing protein [Alkalisalibacterium limincola]|uniref:DUF1704 domain-containing protein n=1 Tax=Alkalisalibacterium limincola TaxID=2699169 RepID=A0A5C8KSM5_9GAMM|nr:tyrosine/phenylalanine carboxypeptidase domain-containing protein [Alkalisalibacterium limincola]TXK62332.1 DUF1704 domain-containing protein [Alkalisalibacterium limincola]